MQFNFKIQRYQTDAVEAVVKVFSGQGFSEKTSYIRDMGKNVAKAHGQMQLVFDNAEETEIYDPLSDTGYKNAAV